MPKEPTKTSRWDRMSDEEREWHTEVTLAHQAVVDGELAPEDFPEVYKNDKPPPGYYKNGDLHDSPATTAENPVENLSVSGRPYSKPLGDMRSISSMIKKGK